MKRSGYADLPLHYGHVPPWLAQRMSKLGGAIIESVAMEYGKSEVVRRLSDPRWFQALGCVLGMDWHSSGITTSVMGALKKAINPRSKELGIYICGGKGKFSRQTPSEIIKIGDEIGIDADALVRSSKLAAKVDNTAIQDGFNLYLHSFILTDQGEWAVVQQGMNEASGYARRYHWHSAHVTSFVEEPHTFIYGPNQGMILNLTNKNASETKNKILELTKEKPSQLLYEINKIVMPSHHDVRAKDVNLKRLGSVLALAQELETKDFESFLFLEGLGPRTLQSLTLVSEVIHGTPSRFEDPARFSFAHGGKDKHPFPVPTLVYDQTIDTLRNAIDKAKIDQSDKQKAIKALHTSAKMMEKDFQPNNNFDKLIENERKDSWKYGGRSVFGKEKPPTNGGQLSLF